VNTNYQTGLYVFLDTASNKDLMCATTVTAASGHLVGLLTSIRPGSYTSVYGRVITASGAMPPSFIVPDVTDNNQRDAGIASIDDTDDFVAVWTSNATGNYRTYIRRFRVASNGTVTPISVTTQLSDSSGDYMAPRVVYLPEKGMFLVLWVAVISKTIQFKYVSYDGDSGQFNDESYITTLNDTIASDYYTNTLDISNNRALALCLLKTTDRAVAAIKRNTNEIGLYEFTPPIAGQVIQKNLPVYDVTNISKFDIAYDADGFIKIVFVQSNAGGAVFGDNVAYYGTTQVVGAPIQLNQTYEVCNDPVILRGNTAVAPLYHVAWSTGNYGPTYNCFDVDFIAQGGEVYINRSDLDSDIPRLAVSDNQVGIVFNADKNGTMALGGGNGILINVLK